MIKREKYLSKIRPFYNKDLIKVIMGIRRSGKSVILRQIIEELKKQNVKEDHILYINFEDIEYDFINDAYKLNKFVKEYIKDVDKYYLLFDEIQMVNNWEKAINSFKATLNVSIFVTGSNNKLLSSELSTLLSGRYVSFKVCPFTFKEIIELKGLKSKDEIDNEFIDYLKWGGMPQRFTLDEEEEIKAYLNDVFNSILVKDIVSRYNIKDIDLLNRIIEYVVTNPSQIFSPLKMEKQFKSENRTVSRETIYNYLEYITSSLIMTVCPGYDIRGKRILTRNNKYYLTDLGLGNIKNGSKKEQKGAYLENIVYNELLYRGYDVYTGNIQDGEVDFVAIKYDKKIYVQVCYILADEDTIKREFGVYEKITDNYPKYVVSMDKLDFSNEGIIHKNIIDFLLDDNL